jgi:hypothetical protein
MACACGHDTHEEDPDGESLFNCIDVTKVLRAVVTQVCCVPCGAAVTSSALVCRSFRSGR